MKSIDLTQPGGFPFTQDQLNYLQSAYTECIGSLAATGQYGTTPYVITGCVVTTPGPGSYSITDGWFVYGGEMIHIPATTLSGVTGGNDPYVLISPIVAPLTYNSGAVLNVIFDKSALLIAQPTGTADDATHFLLSELQLFGVGLGKTNREQTWQSIVVNTAPPDGGVTGTIYYKKDFTANTLQIRAVLLANNAQNFAASPGALFSLMGTVSSGYFPNNSANFIANYYVSSLIKDDLGIAWIKQINCTLNTAGEILINWIRPDVAVAGYGIVFNTILPLD